MSIKKHFLSVSAMTMTSRILGFARDVLIAGVMGAGRTADVFFAAFKIPNMFRSIFGEGALQASFVPMFVDKRAKGADANEFANMAFSWLMAITLGITIILLIAMPILMLLIAPGFAAEPGKLADAVDIARLLFPYMIAICAVGFLSGILNSANKFALVATMPVVLNLFMISGAAAAWYFDWSVSIALSVAVLLSGLTELYILWSRIRRGMFGLRLVRLRATPDMRALGRRMIPGIVGSGAYHINIMIGTIIASLTPGAVSWLYFADRLVQLPFAVVGLAVGTILLTSISKALANNNFKLAHIQQNKSIIHILFWVLPAFAGLAAMAEPIVRVLFERGEFVSGDTMMTATAIAILSIALPAMAVSQVFEKTLFAAKDTRTPVRISIIGILGGTIAAVALYPLMGFLSVAAGTAGSAWFRVIAMAVAAGRRGLFKILPGTIPAAICLAALAGAMFAALTQVHVVGIISLVCVIAAAGAAWLIVAKLTLLFQNYVYRIKSK